MNSERKCDNYDLHKFSSLIFNNFFPLSPALSMLNSMMIAKEWWWWLWKIKPRKRWSEELIKGKNSFWKLFCTRQSNWLWMLKKIMWGIKKVLLVLFSSCFYSPCPCFKRYLINFERKSSSYWFYFLIFITLTFFDQSSICTKLIQ